MNKILLEDELQICSSLLLTLAIACENSKMNVDDAMIVIHVVIEKINYIINEKDSMTF